jgi:DNA-directed RNA polymerase specialized sigma24 family protein
MLTGRLHPICVWSHLQDMIGDEISNALNSLDVDFRTVIILCDLEGFKYDEMAKILDIPDRHCSQSLTSGAQSAQRNDLVNTPKKWDITTPERYI